MAWYDALDEFVGKNVPSWKQLTAAQKQPIFDRLLTFFNPKDADLARALSEAISASNQGVPIIVTILVKLASNLKQFKDLNASQLTAISERLAAGLVDLDDIAVLAGAYLASLQPDGPTRRLFKAIANGKFNGKNVVDKFLSFALAELGDTAKAKIEQLLKDHSDFSAESLTYCFAAAFLAQGKLSSINDEDLVAEFLSKLDGLSANSPEKKRINEVLKAVVSGKPEDLALEFIKGFGLGIEEDVLRELVKGNFGAVVTKALEDVLQANGVLKEHAEALTSFLIKVLEGKVQLLPKSEQELLNLSDKRYALFCRTRIVVFAASKSIQSGSFVPSTPSGSLYGIAASKLEKSTKLVDCVPKANFDSFVQLIRDWSRVEFAKDTYHIIPIASAWPVPIGNTTKQMTIFDVFDNVRSEIPA